MENLQYLSGERFSYVFFFSKTLTRPSLSSSLAKFLAIAMEIIVFYCLKIAYSIMCDDMSVYKGNDSAVWKQKEVLSRECFRRSLGAWMLACWPTQACHSVHAAPFLLVKFGPWKKLPWPCVVVQSGQQAPGSVSSLSWNVRSFLSGFEFYALFLSFVLFNSFYIFFFQAFFLSSWQGLLCVAPFTVELGN